MPRKFLYCEESCRTHNRLLNLEIWQRDWEPPGNLTLEASGIWLQNFHRTRETDSWRAQTKPCVQQEPEERSSVPTSDWVRLPCESPGVSHGSVGQHFGLRPNNREGTEPPPSTENWIQYYWAWLCQSEQDPGSPTVTVSHQEASITLWSWFIRGQTEWKPQSHKINQTDPMATALSNSMKLWAVPCRATQDRQVMVESSDKTWPTGEGNDKPLQYSCLENPMNSMKRQKDRTLKEMEMARVNIDILGISELKWTGICEFNSDDHYICYCG